MVFGSCMLISISLWQYTEWVININIVNQNITDMGLSWQFMLVSKLNYLCCKCKGDNHKESGIQDINDPGSHISLLDVLKNPNGLVLFISQVSQEMCIENVVAFIEFMQFEQYILKHYKKNANFKIYVKYDLQAETELESVEIFETVPSIPTSDIFKQSLQMLSGIVNWRMTSLQAIDNVSKKIQIETQIRILIMITLLIEKYIVSVSPYELNISSKLRTKIDYIYDLIKKIVITNDTDEIQVRMKKLNANLMKRNMSFDQNIVFMFDDVIQTIMYLMKAPFARFQLTKQFGAWQKQIVTVEKE